jgi:hypothetical protein
MLKTLYDHFVVLYHKILPANPSLAADHALKQEADVYKKSTKTTYRNVRSRFNYLSHFSDIVYRPLSSP